MPLQTYQHVQTVASTIWNIQHNLGIYPVVDILVNTTDGLTKIIPSDVKIVDMNTIQIHFSTPHSGQARLV